MSIMMQMALKWRKRVMILFDEWKTSTAGTYWAALIGVFLVAFVHQYLDRLLAPSSPLYQINLRSHRESKDGENSDDSQHRSSTLVRVLTTGVFFIRISLAYVSMLNAMTFNGGVFLAIVLGFTTGYIVFHTDLDEL
ncbi:hypothetical protein KP509_24G040600 [Ceratopteris richardii]|nr:hypothetical protein KP509_24G040600 [Ceratopteris richardii]